MTESRGAWIWPSVGILAVALLWCVSAAANYWAGTQYGSDFATKHLWGGASLASDILKTVMIFVLAAALVRRQMGTVVLAMVCLALCVGWSLRSATLFATSTISERMAEREQAATLASAKKEIASVRIERAKFLSGQEVKLPGSGRPLREALIAERKRTAAELDRQLKRAEADLDELARHKAPTPADPIATVLGVDEKSVIVATVILFALLVEITSATGFWLIARARGPDDVGPAVSMAHPAQPAESSRTPSGPPEPSREPPTPPGNRRSAPKPQPALEQVWSNPEPQPKPRKQARVSSFCEHALRRQVRTLFQRGQAGDKMLMADAYRQIKQAIPSMPGSLPREVPPDVRKVIDRVMEEELGARKKRVGGQVVYVGCQGHWVQPRKPQPQPQSRVSAPEVAAAHA